MQLGRVQLLHEMVDFIKHEWKVQMPSVILSPPQHGLPSKKMAPITSDYGIMICLGIK